MTRYICKDHPDHNEFISQGIRKSLLDWIPEYDTEGRPLNADPNTENECYDCKTCGTTYFREVKGWDITYKIQITDDNGKLQDVTFEELDATPDYIKEKEEPKNVVPDPRKVYLIKEIEMMDIKEGDQFVMYEGTGEPVGAGKIYTSIGEPYKRPDGVTAIKTL